MKLAAALTGLLEENRSTERVCGAEDRMFCLQRTVPFKTNLYLQDSSLTEFSNPRLSPSHCHEDDKPGLNP